MSRPQPPYFAAIFSSTLTDDTDGYGEMSERTETLARQQPGFLGFESARGADGYGISISYWKDAASIKAWRDHVEHQAAITLGYERWYQHFDIKIAKVEHAYNWERS